MKVLILGTSNSILKDGWSFGLKAALKEHNVVSMSVGASPGIQFADKMSIDFSAYNYVFFDSIPNDEEYAYKAKGYGFNEKNEKVIYEIYSTIASQTNLIVLGFCNKWAFNEESSVYKSRKEIAKKIGCQFVDIKLLLKAFLHGNSVDSLYEKHQAHPKRELSYEIGMAIGNELLKYNHQFNHACNNYSSHFITQSANHLNNKTTTFKNSLLSMDVVDVDINTSLDINTQHSCLGVYINAYNTSCILNYNDSQGISHNVRLTYTQRNEEGKFMKIFVPFNEAPIINHLSINCLTPGTLDYHPVITREYKEILHKMQLSSLLYWEDCDISIQHNIEHNVNSLSLSQAVAHSLLEEQIPKNAIIKSIEGIRTHHDSYLILNKKTKKISHEGIKNIDNHSVLIILVKTGNSYTTAILEESSLSIVDVFDGAEISLNKDQNKITIKRNGMFLCAERNGTLTFSRNKAKEWEQFTPTHQQHYH
ncbi:hypothetical protein [Leclercia adecarboxylata]|uniref:hypothetical protein n=1 Tax=Leclercia adecarboxylata TaxID=83655 RepID=UPI00124E326C|nr:hypothetical protein [Leclercia adecarboxylata]QFH49772.1 hypothetical protein FR819_10995 [Leclercia adecarboxylata]